MVKLQFRILITQDREPIEDKKELTMLMLLIQPHKIIAMRRLEESHICRILMSVSYFVFGRLIGDV
jgi:hypothetical protein